MAAPSEPHDDPPGKAPSLLLAAIRRWPLLVLGAGVGSLVGFFVFAAQAPQYQSSAKVLVIKQRVEQLSPPLCAPPMTTSPAPTRCRSPACPRASW